jgi:stage II sporulation protein AA (anti-sigma F factor antagonist)
MDRYLALRTAPSRLYARSSSSAPPLSGADVECQREKAGTVVIRLAGEVDSDTVHILRDALRSFPAQRTIIDLGPVTFADCSLLRVLLGARLRRHLVLAGPLAGQVRRLFQLTATTDRFTFASDVEAAHGR